MRGYVILLHEVHWSIINQEELDRLRRMRLLDVISELNIPKYKWPFLLYRGRKAMNKELPKLKLFEGIKEALMTLNNDNAELMIISSNSKKNIQQFLELHQLAEYFKGVYGGVGLFSKVKILKKAINKNKLTLNNVIYIGDEPRDIEAAHKAGIKAIAVSWGFNDRSVLAEHNPYKIVDTRDELVFELKQWINFSEIG